MHGQRCGKEDGERHGWSQTAISRNENERESKTEPLSAGEPCTGGDQRMCHRSETERRDSQEDERSDCRERKESPIVESDPRRGTEGDEGKPNEQRLAEVCSRAEELMGGRDNAPRCGSIVEDGTQRIESSSGVQVQERIQQREVIQTWPSTPVCSTECGCNGEERDRSKILR